MKSRQFTPLFQARRCTLERAVGYRRWRFISYRGRLWGWPRKELPLTSAGKFFMDSILARLSRLK
nr:MAG TPA: hypothetical protein [Caudoviricetes sp.]